MVEVNDPGRAGKVSPVVPRADSLADSDGTIGQEKD